MENQEYTLTLWNFWHGKDNFPTGITGNDKIDMMVASGLKFEDPIKVMCLDREDLPEDLKKFLQSAPISLIKGRPFGFKEPKKEALDQ